MTPEVSALLAKARESKEAAGVLRREGFFNFAASRAYYAMFYAAEALLLERGLSYSSHAAVIAAFGREFGKSGDLDAQFHRLLIDAQDLRNVGDYDIRANLSEDQVDRMIGWAEELIVASEAYLTAQ